MTSGLQLPGWGSLPSNHDKVCDGSMETRCCGDSVSDKKLVFQLSFIGQLSIFASRRGVMGSSHIVMEQHTQYFYYRKISHGALLLPNLSDKRVI